MYGNWINPRPVDSLEGKIREARPNQKARKQGWIDTKRIKHHHYCEISYHSD